jgi:hypothetical protein
VETEAHPPLRCVILHHEGVEDPHYDLFFETTPGSPLATWRASRWPIQAGDYLVRIADHRRDYLDYEGPISGDRGRVRRVYAGLCAAVALREGHLEVLFTDGRELLLTKDSPELWFCWLAGGKGDFWSS